MQKNNAMALPAIIYFLGISLISSCATAPSSKYLAEPAFIRSMPIVWNEVRETLTKQYRREHYGENNPGIHITPQIIVLHHTAIDSLKGSFNAFNQPQLARHRKNIHRASALNVSVHFLVDQDGTIYKLMDETLMGRHTIGLNWASIGIENVGGNKIPLTQAQAKANVRLIRYLVKKFPTIDTLIAHREYGSFRQTPLWKEKNPHYFTLKKDPSKLFMSSIRNQIVDLNLKSAH